MKTQKFAITGLIASTLAFALAPRLAPRIMTACAPFRGGRRPDQVMRRMMQIWMVTVMAIVIGAGRQARAEVDVVSWGQQTHDQGDLRERYVQIAAGYSHTVALKNDGTLVAWGYNSEGQCNVPSGLTGVTQVAAGRIHTVALNNDGTLVAWGYDNYGQCNVPSGLAGVTQVAAGDYHTVALKNNGTLVAWGRNDFGQCNVPSGLTGVTQVAAGWYHTLALVTFTDCNSNGQRDTYELMHGAPDINLNGVPDACEMSPGDLDLNNVIDFGDVALIMLDFGPCPGCLSDLDGSGVVDFGDVAIALLNFGPTG